jgi:uncharacterized protein (DUF2237 family)
LIGGAPGRIYFFSDSTLFFTPLPRDFFARQIENQKHLHFLEGNTREKGLNIDKSENVFGEELLPCSSDPLTGFFRDGCCNTSDEDFGSHTVCVQASEAFLLSQKASGNDLMTPRPEFDFKGVKPGDRWCLCASRWLEAYRNGVPPLVFLDSTHKRALEIIPLETLERFAAESGSH